MENKFDVLEKAVREAGVLAQELQKKVHRGIKNDGTIVTEADLAVTKLLIETISQNFSESSIVTEETAYKPINPKSAYTFVFDPIDGTDVFSQGLGTWCVGLGILDRNHEPVGSYVYCPSFTYCSEPIFLRTDPDSDKVWLNGHLLEPFWEGQKDDGYQLTVGSGLFNEVDFRGEKLHYRTYGSSILHILTSLVFTPIFGCIDPPCYIWDIAPVHAACKKLGFEYEYIDGSSFSYDHSLMVERKKFRLPLVIGKKSFRDFAKDKWGHVYGK